MSKKKRKINYIKNIVIVHGKSELIICKHIKSNLRLHIAIHSNKKGENNIEINSINKVLTNLTFKNRRSLSEEYPIVDKKTLNKNDLEVFIIMDRDKCSEILFEEYVSGKLFKDHWLKDLITPIYSIESLEDTLKKAGYVDLSKNKKDYIKIFPINRGESNLLEIEEFHRNLLKSRNISNLHLFLEKCLSLVEK